MGVIKPPWISEKWFATCPFNYCDHFGDKRVLVRLCTICANEVDRIGRYRKKGKDPYDIENVLRDVGQTFANVMLSVRKKAITLGIDLDNLPDIEDDKIQHENFLVYRLVYGYGELVGELLNKLWPLSKKYQSELLKKFIDVLDHSRHFIIAKTARALSSKYEREAQSDVVFELADSKTSAFFAYVAVKRNALGSLAFARHAHNTEQQRVLIEFVEISQQIMKNIRREFFPDDELKYEEFGCEEYDKAFSERDIANKKVMKW